MRNKRVKKFGLTLIGLFLIIFLIENRTAYSKKDNLMISPNKELEQAIFAAGCFWGVEEAFREARGVISTTVGYTGGITKDPTYKQVCSGTTGHAEAVKVIYDPKIVNYSDLLNIFWDIHDPTSLNRQGFDFGEQYRSAIFYNDEEQKSQALASKQFLEKMGTFEAPIVTQIIPATEFYSAEEYHQQYYKKKGTAALCIINRNHK